MEEQNLYSESDFGSFEITSQPQKRKKTPLIIGIIVASILVASLIGILAARIWDPLWNPFRPAPEIVLVKAFNNFQQAKSYHSSLDFEVNAANTQTSENFNIVFSSESDTDKFDKQNPKSHSIFTIDMGTSGVSGTVGGEFVQIGDKIFFKLDTIPFLGMFASSSYIAPFVNNIKGKWISFDPKELGIKVGTSSLSPQRREEFQNKMEQLIIKYHPIKVKKELPDINYKGKKAYQILAVLDKENVKKLFGEIIKLVDEYNLLPEEESDIEESIKEAEEVIDKFFDQAKEIETYIIIGKDDYMLYQVKGVKEIKNFQDNSVKDTNNFVNLRVSWSVDFSKYNERPVILEPENSKSIMEIIGTLMGGFLYGSGVNPNYRNYPFGTKNNSGLDITYPQLPPEIPQVPLPSY